MGSSVLVFESSRSWYDHSLHSTLNNTNDSFNDLNDPFLPGHKNLNTKLFDEHQLSTGLL